jgi:hypothetical protein
MYVGDGGIVEMMMRMVTRIKMRKPSLIEIGVL